MGIAKIVQMVGHNTGEAFRVLQADGPADLKQPRKNKNYPSHVSYFGM
jgi:hypothetical protein